MIRRVEGAEDDGGEGADGQHSSGDHGDLGGLVLRASPIRKFSMVGVKVGEMDTIVHTGFQLKVASEATVEYRGHVYKLAPFVRKFMPKRQRNTSGAYQGSKYFTYKGKILDDLRSERVGRN